MLSKRNIIILLFVVFISTSACILTGDSYQNADCPEVPKEEKPKPKDCKVDGNIYFEAPDGEYCFSYPYGYYGYKSPEESNAFIIQSGDPSLSIDPEDTPSSVNLLSPITLKIRYTPNEHNKTLWGFVSSEARLENVEDASPWTISDEEAYIAKRHINKTVIYYIYTQHNHVFYVLEFSAGITEAISISDRSHCADELEKLLFTVNETFHFLRW